MFTKRGRFDNSWPQLRLCAQIQQMEGAILLRFNLGSEVSLSLPQSREMWTRWQTLQLINWGVLWKCICIHHSFKTQEGTHRIKTSTLADNYRQCVLAVLQSDPLSSNKSSTNTKVQYNTNKKYMWFPQLLKWLTGAVVGCYRFCNVTNDSGSL